MHILPNNYTPVEVIGTLIAVCFERLGWTVLRSVMQGHKDALRSGVAAQSS